MDRRELWRRLAQRPRNVSFAEAERLLLMSGWRYEGARGSHRSFEKDGAGLTIPYRRGPILVTYVRDVLKRTREVGDD